MFLLKMWDIVSFFFFSSLRVTSSLLLIEILSAAFAELLDNSLDEVFYTLYIFLIMQWQHMHTFLTCGNFFILMSGLQWCYIC